MGYGVGGGAPATATVGTGERRGIAGDFFVFKAAGARADEPASLEEVKAAAEKANANTRSMGAALAGCTLPGQTEPNFTLPEGEMEIGLGIHGEPGAHRGPIQTLLRLDDELRRLVDAPCVTPSFARV